MARHNKLVRDKIPEIIVNSGATPRHRVIDNNDDYLRALLDKDIEEGKELAQDPNLEELADLKNVFS